MVDRDREGKIQLKQIRMGGRGYKSNKYITRGEKGDDRKLDREPGSGYVHQVWINCTMTNHSAERMFPY